MDADAVGVLIRAGSLLVALAARVAPRLLADGANSGSPQRQTLSKLQTT
jgi:hypothetical protein